MTETRWEVGQDVTTSALAKPMKIVRITPSGIIVTDDGRKFNANGRERDKGSIRYTLRPVEPEDAQIRARDKKADSLWSELDSISDYTEKLRKSLLRGFRRDTPDQIAIDEVEAFVATVRAVMKEDAS